MARPPIALTIAGSDPSGSSGLQADLPTFAAMGAHGTSVVTVVTAQNSTGVKAFHQVDHDLVVGQLDHLLSDLPPAATKTGLLREADVIRTVAERAAAGLLPNLVVDPVLVDSAGNRIVGDAELDAYRELAAHATVLTPNRWEAELLAETRFGDEPDTVAVAGLLALGAPAVVVTGGRGAGDTVVDHVVSAAGVHTAAGPRVGAAAIRGTGCTYSAALTAALAGGATVESATGVAHRFVQRQLERRDALQLGAGRPGLPHQAD